MKKDRRGKNNPNWKGGLKPHKCLACGKKFTPDDHRNRPHKFCSRRCSKLGKNNPQWKDDVGYAALHIWIQARLQKPKKCSCCGKIKKLDLANKSRKYKRNLNDWEWLCRKCHMIKDGVTKMLIEYGKNSRKYGMIICKNCGKDFLQRFSGHSFCGKPCSTTYYNKHIRVYKKKIVTGTTQTFLKK